MCSPDEIKKHFIRATHARNDVPLSNVLTIFYPSIPALNVG